MAASFQDIRITGLNTAATEQSPAAPGLRHMHLALSDSPPAVWCEIFQAERRSPRHSMWRHAWIEEDSIVVNCVPEELEQYHLKDLKEDVTNTNVKFRELLTREAGLLEQGELAVEEEMKRIEKLNSRLKFD